MKNRVKIAHLCNVGTKVGAITSIGRIVNNFESNDFELCVLGYGDTSFHNFEPKVEVYNCKLYFYKLIENYNSKKSNFLTLLFLLLPYFIIDIFTLRKFVKKHNITCIHTHYIIDNFLVAFLPSQGLKKIAHIRSIPNKNFLKGMGVSLFEFVLKYSNTTLIGISNVVLESFSKIKEKHVIYNGFKEHKKSDILSDEQLNNLALVDEFRSEGKFVIGIVSRFNLNKGLNLLVRIANRFCDNSNIIFCIVAPISSSIEEQYKEELKLYNYSNIFYMGSFPHSDYFMPRFDLLLHCTIGREGFGNVVLEALVKGIPVVSTNCGGPSEIISNNINGFVINKNDIDIFCQRIEELSIKGNLYNSLKSRSNGFLKSNLQFTFQSTLFELEKVYYKKLL